MKHPMVWLVTVLMGVGTATLGVVEKDRIGAAILAAREQPAVMTDPAQAEEAISARVIVLRGKSDDELAEILRDHVLGDRNEITEWVESQALGRLAPRTHPMLLELLRDVDVRDELLRPTERGGRRRGRFSKLCEAFGGPPPEEAIAPLSDFTEADSPWVRAVAAATIGRSGKPSIVAPLERAFRDENENVRAFAFSGIMRAQREGRLTPGAASGLYDSMERLVRERLNAEPAIEVALQFDRERAAKFLQSDEVLGPRDEIAAFALEVLLREKVAFEANHLMKLFSDLAEGNLDYPTDRLLVAVAGAIGSSNDGTGRAFLEERLSSNIETVSHAASEGLLAAQGLADLDDRLRERIRKEGFESLPERVQIYLAVTELDHQVRESSLAEYLYKDESDRLAAALRGLEVLGAARQAAALREASTLFGERGPSNVVEARRNQLGRIFGKDPNAFEQIDAQFLAATPSVRVLAARYVLAEPEAFR